MLSHHRYGRLYDLLQGSFQRRPYHHKEMDQLRWQAKTAIAKGCGLTHDWWKMLSPASEWDDERPDAAETLLIKGHV